MGLLDGLLGGMMGAGVTQMLSNYINRHGGLPALVAKFDQQGLGHLVQSWIGTGQNLPITPEQIIRVIGSDKVAQLAAQFGVSAPDIAAKLSELLPKTVDHMTPNGTIPS